MLAEKKFKVSVPDIEYYKELIKCQFACPINTKAGRYVQNIADENFEESYKIAREPNLFPYILGRICAHPCETACRRGRVEDEPVSICALKRVACDNHNSGLGHDIGLKLSPKKKEKVAIIGAGPCGLSCAHDLVRLGYSVTVFEASPVAGGMLYLGIPSYRLPRDIIKMEIDAILNLGVKLKTNYALGKDFSLSDLEKEYDAIFIATGAIKSRDLMLPGVELDGVLKGIEFLMNVNLGYKVDLGRKVVVVGGGNVAIDVARSAARLLPKAINDALEIISSYPIARKEPFPGEMNGESYIPAIDAARLALRTGAREVHLICLESKEEMPAWEWEVEEAKKEGVVLYNSLGPKRIIGEKGKVNGLETINCMQVFDKDGNFNPKFKEGSEKIIKCDSIILAIGQTPDMSWITDKDDIALTRQGTIKIDDSLCTNNPKVFAGGDAAFGPKVVVDVIADGQKAAKSIHKYLNEELKSTKRFSMKKINNFSMPESYDKIKRQKAASLPLNRRIGIQEVEFAFTDKQALTEAKRCLKCQINTIFDGSKCILCGGCVDICPYNCLKMIKKNNIVFNEDLEKIISLRFSNKNNFTFMIKDEEKCIRCGLCSQKCPTGAISMEEFIEEEIIPYTRQL